MDTQQTLQQALAHHQSGQLPQAEALYRQVLQAQPNNADALTVALLRALDTPAERRREYADNAFAKLSDWLDPTGYADEYSDVLSEIANQGER